MKILSIETSCDDTSVAILNNSELLDLQVMNQVEIHRPYGGIVPELASRNHIKYLHHLIKKILSDNKQKLDEIDLVAVTNRPGLVGSLLVGVSSAKTIGKLFKIPVMPINHIIGHIYSVFLSNKDIQPPLLNLIISGGHTLLVVMKDYLNYEIISYSVDDAVGEVYDKLGKYLFGIYPGGSYIDKLYSEYKPGKYINFPLGKVKKGELYFSFSGLKTAVIRHVENQFSITEDIKKTAAVSFQKTVGKILLKKLKRAKELYDYPITLSGGVSANRYLRSIIKKEFDIVHIPELKYCTDNAAMIGLAGYYLNKNNYQYDTDFYVEPQLVRELI